MTSEPRRERSGAEAWPEMVFRRAMEKDDRRARYWRKFAAFSAGVELCACAYWANNGYWVLAALCAGAMVLDLLKAREER